MAFESLNSETMLVRRACRGSSKAFEELVFRYQPRALAIAHAIGVSADDIDDVVQESFLKVFSKLPTELLHDVIASVVANTRSQDLGLITRSTSATFRFVRSTFVLSRRRHSVRERFSFGPTTIA